MLRGVWRAAWGVVRHPITGLAALALLAGDAVLISRWYGNDSPRRDTTAGRFFHRLFDGGTTDSCWGGVSYLISGDAERMRVVDRSRYGLFFDVGLRHGLRSDVACVALYDTWYSERGFWAPTLADESQKFQCVERDSAAMVTGARDEAARRALRDWFLEHGWKPGKFDPTRGDFAETRVLWGGVAHTAGAGVLAVLTLGLLWSVVRVVAARRRAGLAARGLCAECEYDLAGVVRCEGVCVCPECGVGAEGLERRRAA